MNTQINLDNNVFDIERIINKWLEYKNNEIILDLSYLKLNELPILPENIKHLYCNNNLLKNLNNLPKNLISLKCDNNLLININNLPNTLTDLHCHNNNIKTIILPKNLKVLKCDENEISNLILPDTLIYLDCSENNITILNLPESLINLKCDNNNIKELTISKNIKTLISDKFIKIHNYMQLINNNCIDNKIFEEFYIQNIQSCFLKNSYPLNIKNINKWLNKLKKFKDEELNTFGYCISKTIRHISFVEFYNNLCKLGFKLNEFINNNLIENIIFYFYIPHLHKSNLWVLLLIWKYINTLPNIKIIGNLYYIYSNKTITNYKIIYVDDCSYTSTQIIENLKEVLNNKNVNIFIPYISNKALDKLNSYNINVFYIEKFYNFTKLLTESEFDSYQNVLEVYDIYLNSEDLYNENICNIYFDHKLADFVSVFQSLYAYGLLPNNKFSGSFITGCEKFYETNIINKNVIDLQDELSEICPVAFYKNINYKLLDTLKNVLFE